MKDEDWMELIKGTNGTADDRPVEGVTWRIPDNNTKGLTFMKAMWSIETFRKKSGISFDAINSGVPMQTHSSIAHRIGND